MRRLIIEEWLSLDGYVADKNGQLDFFTSPELNRQSDIDQLTFMDSIDTILLGRKTYELFIGYWPSATTDKEPIADKMNSIPKVVFSSTLERAPWGKWTEATVIRDDAAAAIKKLKEQPGKDMVMWGSISIAQELMEKGLVDEFHFRICPAAIGSGRPFFLPGKAPVNLQLTETISYDSGMILLKYRPVFSS